MNMYITRISILAVFLDVDMLQNYVKLSLSKLSKSEMSLIIDFRDWFISKFGVGFPSRFLKYSFCMCIRAY